MLGLRSAAAADPAGGAAGAPMLSGKRVFVVDGGETEVVVSDVYPKCGMIVADAGAAPAQEREYDAARCLFRVRVQRDQEGWARLEFTPVVQYGQELLRPVARDSEWEMVAQRREDRFYPQRFEVLLNIGDMCLITGRTDRHGTPGYRFFLGPDGHDDLQRLFLVRLVHIGRAAAAK